MAQRNVRVGNINDVSGEVNIAGGDIVKNIKPIYQRALTSQVDTLVAMVKEIKSMVISPSHALVVSYPCKHLLWSFGEFWQEISIPVNDYVLY